MIWLMLTLASTAGTIEGTVDLAGKDKGPIIAYVEGDGPAIPDLDSARVIQQGKAFHPDALVIRQGALVDFANEDIVFHHVFSRTSGNTFEIAEYGRGESRSIRFDTPGIVDVQCNKHSWMAATILVLPNAWYATADDEGQFRIEDVEPGPHTLVVWSAGHQPHKVELVVTDGSQTVQARLKKKGPGIQQIGADGIPVTGYSP